MGWDGDLGLEYCKSKGGGGGGGCFDASLSTQVGIARHHDSPVVSQPNR